MKLDDELDRLYGLDPGEFTAARNELAKRLRADKRKDDAAAVAALRKPNVAAAAVNQLVREHPKQVEALLDAGARLRQAQDDALRGGGADALRKATAARQDALTELLELADMRDAAPVEQTLRAASSDPQLAAQLREGRLTKEFDPVGFGEQDMSAWVAPPPKAKATPDDTQDRERELAQLKAELRVAESNAKTARKEADNLAEAVERAKREVDNAKAALERAERNLESVVDEAAAAQRRAEDTEQQVRDAEERLG